MLGGKSQAEFEAEVKRLFKEQPARMKLLIVVDKLLTGFDAPSATYLYIDKRMRDHDLFQAICRVNRTYDDGIKLLENLIDKNEIFEMILIEEPENTSEKIHCPKCDSLIITKIDEEYPCPICKGNVIKG